MVFAAYALFTFWEWRVWILICHGRNSLVIWNIQDPKALTTLLGCGAVHGLLCLDKQGQSQCKSMQKQQSQLPQVTIHPTIQYRTSLPFHIKNLAGQTESSIFSITYHLSYQTIAIDTKNVQGNDDRHFWHDFSTILVSHPVLTQGKHKAVIRASLGLTLRSTSSAWWQNPNPRCPQTHSNTVILFAATSNAYIALFSLLSAWQAHAISRNSNTAALGQIL